MRLLKRIGRQRWVQVSAGTAIAQYLRLVAATSRTSVHPPTIYDGIGRDLPIILAMWHGQHLMMPFVRRGPEHKAKVIVSRHRDGEINAIAAERLGVGTIRGSGDHGGQDYARKGGVSAFRQMLDALSKGWNVATTADVPKVSRVSGLGVIKLAQLSGRPIYPVAITTSRRIVLNNWDRTTINLPFGRMAIVSCEPIRVGSDADDAELERHRRALEDALNRVSEQAREIADGGRAGASRA